MTKTDRLKIQEQIDLARDHLGRDLQEKPRRVFAKALHITHAIRCLLWASLCVAFDEGTQAP